MLLRFAKLAGGLRLLIAEMAPLVVTSTALLSARTVAYLVGFTLGSVGAGWLIIIATLVAVTGLFGTTSNTAECEAYRTQMRRIDDANRATLVIHQQQYKIWYDTIFTPWQNANIQHDRTVNGPIRSENQKRFSDFQQAFQLASPAAKECVLRESSGSCSNQNWSSNPCSSIDPCFVCPGVPCRPSYLNNVPYSVPAPFPPSAPILQTYPSCSSPNCPAGKKTWVQVLWGSPKGNFSDLKGCFIVAYSQDAPTIPVKIEYNPFLPEPFVRSRATSYYLIQGDRFRGVNTSDWKNLESVSGWDKGYWKSETTDPECRGWNPGWSRKVK